MKKAEEYVEGHELYGVGDKVDARTPWEELSKDPAFAELSAEELETARIAYEQYQTESGPNGHPMLFTVLGTLPGH